MNRRWGMGVVLICLMPSVVATASAQRLTLTLTGGAPIAFPAVTEAHYDLGSVPATAALAFTVQLSGGPPGTNRTGSVSIRAASAVMGGTKPIGDLQWSRNDLPGVWNSLTTTNVVVQSFTMTRGGVNNPWGNSILFRTLLSWANDPPATYTPTVIVTTTLTTP